MSQNITGIKSSFKDYFTDLLGPKKAEQFFSSLKAKETRRSLRINTLKVDKKVLKECLESSGYTVRDNSFSKDGIDIEGKGVRFSLKLPYHAGFTYPQDSSSMFAVELLDPQPGETVLDLTAAPGGKTTHIAQRMKNTGVLLANDIDTRRLKALHSNLERLGVWNVVSLRIMPHTLVDIYPETFDRILLDPSCSGEGLLVTRDGKPGFWSPKSLKRYSAEQYGLLRSAFRLLKPGGRLVYSTCTLNTVENDGVVQRLLDEFPEAKIDDMSHVKAMQPEQIEGFMGIRFWPHKTKTKGFFCIALTKTESLGIFAKNPPTDRIGPLKKKQAQEYLNYIKKTFGVDMPPCELSTRDDHLFVVSKELSSFSLPSRYSLAFPLLKIHKTKLRPTHAGALYLALHAKKQVFEADHEMLNKIFDRQPIENTNNEQGLFLVRYKNFPIGIAKLTEKRIEVLLPRQF